MTKITITGQPNLAKIKDFLEKKFKDDLSHNFPALKAVLQGGFINIRVDVDDERRNRKEIVLYTDGNEYQRVTRVNEFITSAMNFFDKISLVQEEPAKETEAPPKAAEQVLSMSLAELEISVRLTSCLESAGITTVGEVIDKSENDLLEIRNFGEVCLRELKMKLNHHNLRLKDG